MERQKKDSWLHLLWKIQKFKSCSHPIHSRDSLYHQCQ